VRTELETTVLDQGRDLSTLRIENGLLQIKVKEADDYSEEVRDAYQLLEGEFNKTFDGQDKQIDDLLKQTDHMERQIGYLERQVSDLDSILQERTVAYIEVGRDHGQLRDKFDREEEAWRQARMEIVSLAKLSSSLY